MSTNTSSTYAQRQEWRELHLQSNDTFITNMPKIELHVHIEGTMTPELRWKLSQRNSAPLTTSSQKVPLTSIEETREAYKEIRGRIGAGSADATKHFTFFEAYYGGFELLTIEEDYFDLAIGYFERARAMNVRYCEVFFDAQGNTRRGISMDVLMRGLKRAQKHAEQKLNIMCILRDTSPASAMAQYEAALPYKNMIIGIGLDSDEKDRPPLLFEELFLRVREDGFKITSHCDFNQKDTHEHIRQVAVEIGGSGADRIDHGLNAVDRDELIDIIKEREIGMPICPCAYIRHTPDEQIFPRIRKLFDTGIKISIASDDPAYMEDNWVLHNLLMVQDKCCFTRGEMVRLQRNAIQTCWAEDDVKKELLSFLDTFVRLYQEELQPES